MLTIVENANSLVTYFTSLALNGTELLEMILNTVNSDSPLIKNETLNTAVFTKGQDTQSYTIIQMSSSLHWSELLVHHQLSVLPALQFLTDWNHCLVLSHRLALFLSFLELKDIALG